MHNKSDKVKVHFTEFMRKCLSIIDNRIGPHCITD